MIALAIAAFCLFCALIADHMPVVALPFTKMSLIAMIVVGLFGAKLVDVFGLITNAGIIVYSHVVLCIAIIAHRYGKESAMNTLYTISLYAVFAFVLVQLIALYAPAPTDTMSTVIDKLAGAQAKTFFGSLMSFYVSELIYIWCSDRLLTSSTVSNYVLSALAAQAVDSVLFFSFLYTSLSGTEINTPIQFFDIGALIVSGMIVKTTFLLLSVPVYCYVCSADAHVKERNRVFFKRS